MHNLFLISASILILVAFAVGYAIAPSATPIITHEAKDIVTRNALGNVRGNVNDDINSALFGTGLFSIAYPQLQQQIAEVEARLGREVNSKNEDMIKLAEIVEQRTGKSGIKNDLLAHFRRLQYFGYGSIFVATNEGGNPQKVGFTVESNFRAEECQLRSNNGIWEGPKFNWGGTGGGQYNYYIDTYKNEDVPSRPGWYFSQDSWLVEDFKDRMYFPNGKPPSVIASGDDYETEIRCKAEGSSNWLPAQRAIVHWGA